MDISQFKTESSKTEGGVWIDGRDGCRVKIRSSEYKGYQRVLAAEFRKESANKVRKDPETQKRAITRAMAKEIILDWEGVESDGVKLEPTYENKLAFLQVTELREWIATEALDLTNFQEEGLAADAEDIKSGDSVGA